MRLERRLQAFNAARGALLDEMEALDPDLLAAKPLAGKWSILEIIEHLVLAERAVFRGLPDPSRLVGSERRLGHRVRYLLVLFVLNARIRVRVPAPAMIPRGDRTLAELRRLWDRPLPRLTVTSPRYIVGRSAHTVTGEALCYGRSG